MVIQPTAYLSDYLAQTQSGHLAEADRIRKDVTAPIYQRISEAVQQIAALSRETLRRDQQTKGFFRNQAVSLFLLALTLLVAGLVAAVLRRTRHDLRSRLPARLITSGSTYSPRPRARSVEEEKKWPKLSA